MHPNSGIVIHFKGALLFGVDVERINSFRKEGCSELLREWASFRKSVPGGDTCTLVAFEGHSYSGMKRGTAPPRRHKGPIYPTDSASARPL